MHSSTSIDGFSGKAAIGMAGDYDFTNLLERTPDPFFKDDMYSRVSKAAHAQVPSALAKVDLDITRISNRIVVMGRCWNYRTDKSSSRNNIDEVALFLNSRYSRSYLIWNLGSPDSKYDPGIFRNQVANFHLSKLLTPTVKNLFNICRSLAAWIYLDKNNVAIVHCKNGRNRTGLAIACFLRYCELFDSAYESFEYFLERRSPMDSSWVTVTLRRYLRYFNDILILNGRVPNARPLKLHQILLNTIPNFDGTGNCEPGIEVYQNGKLTYSSAIHALELNGRQMGSRYQMVRSGLEGSKMDAELSQDETIEDDEELLHEFHVKMALQEASLEHHNALVLKDSHHIVFRLESMILHRDVQIRVYHRNVQIGQNTTILNLAFNTAFIAPGLIRLRPSDLELPLARLPPSGISNKTGATRFSPEFALDLVVTSVENASKLVSYESSTVRSHSKDLLKLSQFHCVRADPLFLKPLELQGYRKFFARLALQLGNNDIHLAHEFLTGLVASPSFEALDKELVTLGKMKYDKLKAIRPRSGSESSVCYPTPIEPVEEPQKSLSKAIDKESQITDYKDTVEKPKQVAVEDSATKPFSNDLLKAIKNLKLKSNAEIQSFQESSSAILTEARQTLQAPSIQALSKASQFESISDTKTASGKSCVVPPPPPFPFKTDAVPLFPPKPHPPVPPLFPSTSQETSGRTSPSNNDDSSKKPRIKNRLNWSEIKDQKRIRNSIWIELMEQFPEYNAENLDVHKFEELFCINPDEEKRQSATIRHRHLNPRERSACLLELKRAQNIGIGLSRFYKRLTDSEILESILLLDNRLSLDDLLTLKGLLPTDEEKDMFRLYEGPLDGLNRAELFAIEMLKEPNIAWMVEALIYTKQFDHDADLVINKVALIIALMAKLRESPALKVLLKAALEIGNLASYDYGRVSSKNKEKAVGFTIDSLSRLHEVKSIDRKTTLVQFLAASLYEKHPEIGMLHSDFSDLSVAKHWEVSIIKSQYEDLKNGLDKLKNRSTGPENQRGSQIEQFRCGLDNFIKHALERLDRAGEISARLDEMWNKTCEYFGESKDDHKPEELFAIFDQFFRCFHLAIEAYRKQSSRQKLSKKNANTGGSHEAAEENVIAILKESAPMESITPNSESETTASVILSVSDSTIFRTDSHSSFGPSRHL